MTETTKSNVQLDEQSITTTPEQAVNAAMPEQMNENESTTRAATTEAECETENANCTRPATREEILQQIQEIAEKGDVLSSKNEV